VVEAPKRVALVRPDVFDLQPGTKIDPKNGLLGVAGSGYRILQNTEAFTFFDDIVGSKQAIYHTCGALDGGKKVWILAKLPDSISVLKDDDVDKYLLLANGHTGTSGLTIRFTPVRVVCQNTLSQALYGGGNESVFTTHHGAGLMDRMTKAHVKMGIVSATYKKIAEGFQAMAKRRLTKEERVGYFDRILPMPGDDQKSNWCGRPKVGRRWANWQSRD
jgi:phage/plasmid-like protein (TIGR03299 family)